MEDHKPEQTGQSNYEMPSGEPVIRGCDIPAPIYASAPAPAKKASSKTGLILGIVAIVAVCLVIIVGITSCTAGISRIASSFGLSDADSGAYDSTPKIGVINIEGTIQYDGTSSSPGGLRALLDQAEKRDDVVAVVLRVNSGGGTATAGEEMAQSVAEFTKPIIVSSASTNASAAYEISSQADYIFVAKTTSIGSIGVAMQLTDLSGLYDMLGIRIENITSADSKDATYGNRPLTEEERAWYQNMVDQIDNDFIETVSQGRDMPIDDVRALANGLTYTGIDAVDNGLADELGYYDDAINYASTLAGYDKKLPTTSLTLSSSSGFATLLDFLGKSTSDANEELINAIQQLSNAQKDFQ